MHFHWNSAVKPCEHKCQLQKYRTLLISNPRELPDWGSPYIDSQHATGIQNGGCNQEWFLNKRITEPDGPPQKNKEQTNSRNTVELQTPASWLRFHAVCRKLSKEINSVNLWQMNQWRKLAHALDKQCDLSFSAFKTLKLAACSSCIAAFQPEGVVGISWVNSPLSLENVKGKDSGFMQPGERS